MSIQVELTALAIVVFAALVCGMVLTRLRQPAVVGYILAGIILGPSGFSLVENREQISFLAELGVLLLLFSIGTELSLRGFRAIWMVAVGAAAMQISAAVATMLLASQIFGWSLGVAVLLGFVVALSSTAVAVKMLEDMNILRTRVGQVTVSILIGQDLAIVPMLLVLKLFSGEAPATESALKIAASFLLLGLLVWYLSRQHKVRLPLFNLLAGSIDLRPLYGLTLCFGAATITGLLGLSAAYGAFLAGLVVGNSTARRVMLRSVQPVQSVLMMIFFLSIGLLIDLEFIWSNIGTVLLILFVVIVVKTLLNIGILVVLREPWPHAFITGLMLAQIGEFSFLLGATALDLELIGRDEYRLIVAVTALSLIVSPLWLLAARRFMRIAIRHVTSLAETLEMIRKGGLKAFWLAARYRPISAGRAFRIFGRPGWGLDRPGSVFKPHRHSGDSGGIRKEGAD